MDGRSYTTWLVSDMARVVIRLADKNRRSISQMIALLVEESPTYQSAARKSKRKKDAAA